MPTGDEMRVEPTVYGKGKLLIVLWILYIIQAEEDFAVFTMLRVRKMC